MVRTDQIALLEKMKKCLNPGGKLIFDVFGHTYRDTQTYKREWYVSQGNDYWSKEPYCMLKEVVDFPENNVVGVRDIIIKDNEVLEFIFWDHYYTEEKITGLLNENGYTVLSIDKDLITKNEFTSNDVLFVECQVKE